MYREGRRNRAQQNQSIVAFPWQDLVGDLKLEILSRLPPKSLLRFKCVCKHWLSLFLDPSFIHKHLLHPASTACDDDDSTLLVHGDTDKCVHSTSSLLKLKDPPNPVTFNLNRQFPDEINLCDMNLVGTINGLVCLSSGRRTGASVLLLWNPATKHCTKIPTPNIKLPSRGSRFTIGFCFDSLRNDYKIVRLVWSEPVGSQPRPRTEVYSVSADCWREIEVELPFRSRYPQCDTIVRGESYWSAHYLSSKHGFVVWFDACEEVFRRGPSLALGWPCTTVKFLVNFENSVAVLASEVVSSCQGTYSFFINGRLSQGILMVGLWVMEDESCQWSLKFNAEFWRPISLVGCSKNGDIVFSRHHVGVLQLYNPRTQETSNTRIGLEFLGSRRFSFRVSDYTASLVPVRKSKQAEKEGNPYPVLFNVSCSSTSLYAKERQDHGAGVTNYFFSDDEGCQDNGGFVYDSNKEFCLFL